MKFEESPISQGKKIGTVVLTFIFLEMAALGAAVESKSAEKEDRQQGNKEEKKADRIEKLLEAMEEKVLQEETGSQESARLEELKEYEKELLQRPKKDRLRYGGDFDLTYDNNVARGVIRAEEGDTTFILKPFVELDLSGRRTDFRAEFKTTQSYRVKVSEGSDTRSAEVSLRAGRKIAKKTTLSFNGRLNRTSARDVEIDDDGRKITYDNSHQGSLNYEMNRKFSASFDTNYTATDYPHENFDQDGTDQIQLSPNLNFQMTPKTRLSIGYRWTQNMTKTKSSDNTKNEIRLSYTGKITGKSTLSVDFTQAFSRPDAAAASHADETTVSVGYIWAATPKSSIRFQYSNTTVLSLSDSISGDELLKSATRTASDAWSTSFRFKLHRKLSAEFSSNISHSHSKTKKTGSDNTRSRTFTFPFQTALDYQLLNWLQLRFTYTYRHQIGNEESDEHRAHTWFVHTNISL